MGFIFSLFGAVSKGKEAKSDLEAINSLKNRLVEVGFASEEVEYMIREHANKKSLTELGAEEIKSIREALSIQLDIAQKCLNLMQE